MSKIVRRRPVALDEESAKIVDDFKERGVTFSGLVRLLLKEQSYRYKPKGMRS